MKKAILLLIPLAMILLCMGLVSAQITITDGGRGASPFEGVVQINFTMNDSGGGYGAASVTSCNASMVSSLSANNTKVWAFINGSETYNVNMTWTINITSTLLEDATDYTVYINCSNSSASFFQGTLLTGVTVDNTVPTAASSIYPVDGALYTSNNTVDFRTTINDANTIYAYVVWRDMSPTGNALDAMSCSGTTCTLEAASVSRGVYYWTVKTSDGTNSTQPAWQYFNDQYGKMTGAAKIAVIQATTPSTSGKSNTGLIVIVVIAVAGLLYWNSTKKKK